MRLKVLCDENIPGAVIKALRELDFNVKQVTPGLSDSRIAVQAKREKRTLITFDSDFANILAYPPQEFYGIIRIRISPPFGRILITSLKNLFRHFRKPVELRGKLIILEAAAFRVWKK